MLIRNRPEAGIAFEEASDGGAGAGSSEVVTEAPSVEVVQLRLAEAEKELKIARREAKERRERLEAIDADAAKRKDAELSEADAAKKRTAELEAKLAETTARHRAERISNAVTVAALELDFINAKAAARLADLSGVQVDDETGEITGVVEALKALAKSDPYLLKQANGAGNINATERGRQDATTKGTAQAVLNRAYARPKEA